MPNQKTRKAKRGGGPLNYVKGKLGFTNTTPVVGPNGLTNAQRATLNVKKRKSQSKVANYLKTPGEFKYTNKERIEKEFRLAVEELKEENPEEVKQSVLTIQEQIIAGLKSQVSRETGAVIITLPVGIAQILVKALRVFLAFFALFVGFAATLFGSENAIARIVSAALPNTQFNTTSNAYRHARKFTGATM